MNPDHSAGGRYYRVYGQRVPENEYLAFDNAPQNEPVNSEETTNDSTSAIQEQVPAGEAGDEL